MKGCYAALRRLAQINSLGAIALVAFIALGACLWHQAAPLRAKSYGIVALERAGTAQKADTVIKTWGEANRSIAKTQVWWDFAWIVAYAWLALYVGFKAAQYAEGRNRPTLARLARIAGIGGLVMGLCDCAENIGMLRMLRGHVTDAAAWWTWAFASTKFILLAAGAVVVLITALIARLWPGVAPRPVAQPADPPDTSPILPAPEAGCDVIMKGGITSGVVYPRAIIQLSEKYHFSNVGGTSAGGIAAAVAAAAEYGRASGGFKRIAQIPKELGENLLKLFQPSPSVQPLFNILVAGLDSKPKPGTPSPRTRVEAILRNLERYDPLAVAASKNYPRWAVGGVLLPLAFTVFTGDLLAALFGVLLCVFGWATAVGGRVGYAALVELTANDYGFCTGATQDARAYGHTAVSEWLADVIDECAGLKQPGQPGGDPLTFGHLKKPPHGKAINLVMMTTNISMRRPYSIPFKDRTLYYRESDIRKLMPGRVAEYMIRNSEIVRSQVDKTIPPDQRKPIDDFRHVPDEENFPVVLATRLSLSFPILFTAIPLYASDFTLTFPNEKKDEKEKDEKREKEIAEQHERERIRRCYFSDGGMSNNFPIQLFDQLWPNTPTFGIGLDEFDRDRNPETKRVWLPLPLDENGRPVIRGARLPILPLNGLPDFLLGILYTAKDWQDNLQSTLVGYRERIVHVALKSDEGGLNLNMDKDTILALAEYGKEAGDALNAEFNLDDHRWRRFLVAMTRLEQTFMDLDAAYNGKKGSSPAASLELFSAFLKRYPPNAIVYKPEPKWLEEARQRITKLIAMTRDWAEKPLFQEGQRGIPTSHSDMRITSKP